MKFVKSHASGFLCFKKSHENSFSQLAAGQIRLWYRRVINDKVSIVILIEHAIDYPVVWHPMLKAFYHGMLHFTHVPFSMTG